MSDSAEFVAIMPEVADAIFGEFIGKRNKAMSTAKEWRWGTNGSVAVDLIKGTYFDNEEGTGGGVLDLVQAYKGFDKPAALDWLVKNGYLKQRDREDAGQGRDGGPPQGKFAGFMDDHPVATYRYYDDQGALAYEVLKFAKTAPRRFMQRRPHPKGGWIWGLQAGTYGKVGSGDWFKAKEDKKYKETADFEEAPRWLYNRAAVLAAVKEGRRVILVEGEKDADTIIEWGMVGTTNAGGAKYWQDSFDEELTGAHIIISHDNDDVGRQRALLRGAGLSGKCKSVRVLDLSLHWNEMPPKADVTDWKEKAGGSAERFEILAKKAPLWKPEAPKSRYGAFTWDSLDGQGLTYDYLIDGFLTERGRSIIGGPSGSGKSFLAIHAAMCIARGQDFFDREVKRAGVIYQAGEGGHGIKKRFRAYRKHFNVSEDEDIPLVVLPAKIDLFSKEGDTKSMIEEIKAWKITMTIPLGILFIDTLATATIGADENSGKDMSVVLANIALIEEECGIHVCLVHHMNADGKKLRGHTSIHANVDQVILVTQDEDTRVRSIKLVKQKDDEDGVTVKFKLASVEVGVNPKTGKEATSCVVLSVTEAEMLKKEQERLGYSPSPTERRILMNLFATVDRHGRYVATPTDGPAAAKGRHIVEWRAYTAVALEKMPEVDDKKQAMDQIRKEFTRAKDQLIKSGVIQIVSPYLWWDGKPVRGFARTFPRREVTDNRWEEPISPGMQEVMDLGSSDYEVPL